jgi:hypothetical protein
MAKPYRRRRGKKFVGSYRYTTTDGRDVNLQTKDANEAHQRSRLAEKGLWPPEDAAAAAGAAALDPTAEPEAPGPIGPEDPTPAPAPRAPPSELPPPAPEVEREPRDVAGAAAAAEAAGVEVDEEGEPPPAQTEEDEVRAMMAELGSDEVIDQACDGLGAFLLKAEGWALALGVNWALKKRKRRIEIPQPSTPDSIERKCLRVGLKVGCRKWLPGLFENMGPGAAIVAGLSIGGVTMLAGASIVDADTGAPVGTVADLMQKAAQNGGAAKPGAPGAPLSVVPSPLT